MKFILLLLALVACSSFKKEAIELSEKGLHEEAIPKWAAALAKDPKDTEVQLGLRASQDIVLNAWSRSATSGCPRIMRVR